jgi:hypothetical protein
MLRRFHQPDPFTGRRLTAAACLAAALLCPACGPARKTVYPVRGQVRLADGRAPAHALVTFHPVGDAGPEAVHPAGEVDEQGRFTLTSYAAGDGAPAGEYRVSVVWYLAPGRDDDAPRNYLPDVYSRPDATPLPPVTVAAGANELPPIELPAR